MVYLISMNTPIEIEPQAETSTLTPADLEALQQSFVELSPAEATGVRLFIDSNKEAKLAPGEQRVYPFTDEARDLLNLIRKVQAETGMTFERVVDCFAGGGNSLLPMIKAGIAKRGIGIDLNPRAVKLAEDNAKLNQLGDRATFIHDRVENVGNVIVDSDKPTLFIANPPFALTVKGHWAVDGVPGNPIDQNMMRAGGHDGLALTRAYIEQSLAKAFTANVLESSKPGDLIIGVAYSRLGTKPGIELENELRAIVGDRGTFTIELVPDTTLWRGPNGKKEQPNPMPVENMNIKGTTDIERAEYDAAAASHKAEGYEQIGYFRYVIKVGKQAMIAADTASRVKDTI